MSACLSRHLLFSSLLVIGSIIQSQVVLAEPILSRDSALPAPAPFRFVSVFDHYSVFRDQPILPWRDTNDLAGSLGGWRFYAREGRKPVLPPPPAGLILEPAVMTPSPNPGDDSGRHDHGVVR